MSDWFGKIDEEIERNRKSMRRLFWVMVACAVGRVTLVVWVVALVIQNPEAIGGWFRRLFGGGP